MTFHVLTYVILAITFINTYFLYFYEGFAPAKQQSLWAFATMAILALIGVFYVLYQGSTLRVVKKSCIRIALFLSIVLFVLSLYSRATEVFDGWYAIWRWAQTLLYGLIILTIIGTADKFYKKLQNLVKKQQNYFN